MSGVDVDQAVHELVPLMARFMRLAKGSQSFMPHEVHEVFERNGLGMRHVPVVITVCLDGPSSVGEIADHVALNPATTSQLVNELVRAGLVHRDQDPHDRRRAVVSMASKYREQIYTLASRRQQILHDAMSRLTADERKHFIHGWRTVVETAEGSVKGS